MLSTSTEYKNGVMENLRIEFDEDEERAIESRMVNGLQRPHLLYHAVTTPILTSQELEALGFVSTHVRQALEGLNGITRREMFDLGVTTYQRGGDRQATTCRDLCQRAGTA